MSDYKTKLDSLTDEERKDFERAMMDMWIENNLACDNGGREVLNEILAKRTPPQPVYDWWRPKLGELCHYIDSDGDIMIKEWRGDPYCESHLAIGNIFPVGQASPEKLRTTARRFYENACRIANGGTLLPKDRRFWVIDRKGVNSWSKGDSLEDVLVGVADEKTALAIRAAMQEKGLLQHFFGE